MSTKKASRAFAREAPFCALRAGLGNLTPVQIGTTLHRHRSRLPDLCDTSIYNLRDPDCELNARLSFSAFNPGNIALLNPDLRGQLALAQALEFSELL